jgi:ADP-ribose pyrophosphatase YjhB (NUDIX family)
MTSSSREAEIAELCARYGLPARRQFALPVSCATYDWWVQARPERREEVVLFIQRRNGNFILHSKCFYPEGAFRVPSGGVKENELLIDAVHRETFEETGLQVSVERFLAIVEFQFCREGNVRILTSYLFLLHELAGELRANDTQERISAFAEMPLRDLTGVAQRLECLSPDWCDWGRYRAFAHRLACEVLAPAG